MAGAGVVYCSSQYNLILVQDSEVLLLRRYNTGHEDGNYGVVAGHVEEDEEILVAMAREAREEAGINIPPATLTIAFRGSYSPKLLSGVVGVILPSIDLAAQDVLIGNPSVQALHRRSDLQYLDFFLTARSWSGDIRNMEPDKCDDLAWFRLDSLPDNVIPYVRKALSNYTRGQWFDSFGWS